MSGTPQKSDPTPADLFRIAVTALIDVAGDDSPGTAEADRARVMAATKLAELAEHERRREMSCQAPAAWRTKVADMLEKGATVAEIATACALPEGTLRSVLGRVIRVLD